MVLTGWLFQGLLYTVTDRSSAPNGYSLPFQRFSGKALTA